MTDYLVDTNVFVYARGGPHAYSDPCRRVLEAVHDRAVTLHASVELLQELCRILLRRAGDRADALAEVEEVRSACRIHDFQTEVWEQASDLLERYPQLGVRDAVHAATALHTGLGQVISTDQVFDQVAELARIDPAADDVPWSGR